MNTWISRSSGAILAFFVVCSSFGQAQVPGKYHAVPGSLEFTGEMIVRPLQADALAKKGIPAPIQNAIRQRARQRLLPLALEYVSVTDEYVIDVPRGENENSYSVKLMNTGDYQYATPNWLCYPAINPNDPNYNQQWHHPKVKSPQAWDLITGSSLITVGIVDTGVDLTHPDLQNRVPGYNSVDRLSEANGGQVNDLNGHGTHTSGDAAAMGNNNIGVAGMGWNFKFMMVRTSNEGGGGASFADLLDGARYAATHGCTSVSVSYSGIDNPEIGTTGTFIKSQGSLLLWAAGNDNRDLSGFFYNDVIVVGASDENDGKAGFSAYGHAVHVFAPGTNIVSTTLGGGYGGSSGTSMAAPIANGACALIRAMNPTLTAQQVQDILENNCDNIGSSAIFGHGRINQFKNVLAAQAATPIDVDPDSISVYEGVYMGGTLANILVPNTGGQSYDVRAIGVARNFFPAGVIITFHPGTTPSALTSLEFFFQAKEVPLSVVTAFVYLWNFDTNQYDSLVQFPVNTTFQIKSKKITFNPGRYIDEDGLVKVLYRAVSTAGPGRTNPYPYLLNFGYTHLKYTEQP